MSRQQGVAGLTGLLLDLVPKRPAKDACGLVAAQHVRMCYLCTLMIVKMARIQIDRKLVHSTESVYVYVYIYIHVYIYIRIHISG